MVASNDGSHPPVQGLTYYYDFIRLLEQEYAFASVESVAEEIKFARAVGPALAGLTKRDDGVFIIKAPIGRGHFALVELEFDSGGVLQPVMGGFLRK